MMCGKDTCSFATSIDRKTPTISGFLLLLQLFFSLLRDKTQHDPRRSQVRKALDMIPPVLARYKSKGKTPDWLPYIKKWWVEEGPNLPLMIHFWQLVVRHSDVFYPCR